MNITRITQQFISHRPSIKDCLFRGLINYSALAREICRQQKLKNTGAVIVACRRYQARVRSQATREQVIRELISHAKLRLKTKMAVIIIERPKDFSKLFELHQKIRSNRDEFTMIEGESVVTLITTMDALELVRQRLKNLIVEEQLGLALLTLIFDKRIETTSGVVSFVYGLLAEHGINVLEEASCWTDVMMLISERDLPRAVEALNLTPGKHER